MERSSRRQTIVLPVL
ncbi:hypothetical protein F383_31151 [Gossypium arboreum]|uniref:Uncharacterized protein n=1 Tax=Gossypium arboreum TaxID=29729 RepID=A0A0B0PDQ5_GOSAR|nr:hypothetical protein F383_31151 [Gossypium arboreum]